MMGLAVLRVAGARDIRTQMISHHFAKRNGFRESFSNTQCFVCFSGSVLEITGGLSFALGAKGCHAIRVSQAAPEAGPAGYSESRTQTRPAPKG
jgi:hypothetical protein